MKSRYPKNFPHSPTDKKTKRLRTFSHHLSNVDVTCHLLFIYFAKSMPICHLINDKSATCYTCAFGFLWRFCETRGFTAWPYDALFCPETPRAKKLIFAPVTQSVLLQNGDKSIWPKCAIRRFLARFLNTFCCKEILKSHFPRRQVGVFSLAKIKNQNPAGGEITSELWSSFWPWKTTVYVGEKRNRNHNVYVTKGHSLLEDVLFVSEKDQSDLIMNFFIYLIM